MYYKTICWISYKIYYVIKLTIIIFVNHRMLNWSFYLNITVSLNINSPEHIKYNKKKEKTFLNWRAQFHSKLENYLKEIKENFSPRKNLSKSLLWGESLCFCVEILIRVKILMGSVGVCLC